MYLRARHYNPFIGRFLSRDSYAGDITRPLSLNRYTYTENNPVNYVDPSGRVAYVPALAGIGGAINAAYQAGYYIGTSQAGHDLGISEGPTLAGTADAAGKGFLVGASGAGASATMAALGQAYAIPSTLASILTGATGGAASQVTSNLVYQEPIMSNVPSSIVTNIVFSPIPEMILPQRGFPVRSYNFLKFPNYTGLNTWRLYGQQAIADFWQILYGMASIGKK